MHGGQEEPRFETVIFMIVPTVEGSQWFPCFQASSHVVHLAGQQVH